MLELKSPRFRCVTKLPYLRSGIRVVAHLNPLLERSGCSIGKYMPIFAAGVATPAMGKGLTPTSAHLCLTAEFQTKTVAGVDSEAISLLNMHRSF